jgi:hypothetical protein
MHVFLKLVLVFVLEEEHKMQLEKRNSISDGYKWVSGMELEKFFDKVNYEILMYELLRNIKDK